MGRRLLLNHTTRLALRGAALLLAVVVSGACAGPPAGALSRTGVPLDDDGHRDLACADCHDGPLADRDIAQVPEATCTASDCHADGGPRVVELGSVVFEHRSHAGDSVAAMGCAGCHTHADPQAPLSAEVDACSFCHLSEQAAGAAGECRLCHDNLEHAGLTSQGVDVPHDDLPWVDGGCVRCHYDVTEPPVEVPLLRCAACHADLDEVVAQGIGEDLHESHTSASCVSCHEEGAHHIRALSTAVDLSCVDCHRQEHDVAVTAEFPDAATCNRCHGDAHRDQQRMLLGLVDDLTGAWPSDKFMDGLTCRSCHVVEPSADPSLPIRGQVSSCATCHRTEYGTVAEWWRAGSTERLRRATAYVAAATTRLGSGISAEATAELEAAGRLLAQVRSGGAVHNLSLAHRMMAESSEHVAQAYTLAGRGVPPTPDFGREPRMGLCSYCHYRADDPWVFQEMSGPFHREVLRQSGGR